MLELLTWGWPILGGGLVAVSPKLWEFFSGFWNAERADRISQQGWTRADQLETEITTLRVLLDRSRRRESAKDAVIELLLLALELGDQMTEETISAFTDRAKANLQRSIEFESR